MSGKDNKISLETGLSQIALARKLDGVKISSDIVKSDNFQEQYQGLSSLIDYLTTIKKAVDDGIKKILAAEYNATGEASISTEEYNFTYTAPSTRESFDSSRFKQEHPELYVEYVKVANVSESLRVTKKKKSSNKDDSIDAEFSKIK